MTMASFFSLIRNRQGSAAAEMVLVTPLLLVIMFGSVELGNYFYNNHIVIKGVRDGARYASRRAFANYTCPGAVVSNDDGVLDATRRVTRTGQATSGGTARLWTWTNDNMVDVTVECTDNSAEDYKGIYTGLANVPVVRVSATVPYGSLLSGLGFDSTALTITAVSEAPVTGA